MKNVGYNVVSLAFAAIAAYMIATDKPDWGWLIFAAVIVWTFPDVDKNKKVKSNKAQIKMFEKKLIYYKEELAKNPDSTFHKGLVKNTEEYIQELKGE